VNYQSLNITAPYIEASSASIVNMKFLRIGNESTTFVWDNSASSGWPPVLLNTAAARMVVDVNGGYTTWVEWIFQNYGTIRVVTGEPRH
jgi:hypothetical protein